MTNKITYAPIVPLIGGEPLGIQTALDGQLPEYVLSYSPFAKNDSHYINYLRSVKSWNGDYVHLDIDEDYTPQYVDVVAATCPCAGLSSYSNSSGAQNATNDWMYRTAEYVLSKIQPKVFWGENAPRLYSASGKGVADSLYQIARKYGYSLTLYYTESCLHGLSQKRPRTFYFLVQGDQSAIFPWHYKESEPIEDILNMPYAKDDPMNVVINTSKPQDSAWVAYNMAQSGSTTLKELYDSFEKTENLIVYTDGGYGKSLYEVSQWMKENGFDKTAERALRMQEKKNIGKGYWAHGETLPKGNRIPALIGAMPYMCINIYNNSYLSARDCLRIMKMPEDFNLCGDNISNVINHVCQNVPVTTARDMMLGVCDFLNGKTTYADSSYTKQNNKTKVIFSAIPSSDNINTLNDFFNLQTK